MIRIAHITDIHLNQEYPKENNVDAERNWKLILQDVSDAGISDIVVGGDIGDPSAYDFFFKTLETFNWKLTLGNHDNYNTIIKFADLNNDHASELYYSTEDMYFKYLFLDTSAEKISDVQLRWIESTLNTNKKIILFMHHPILGVDAPADRLYPLENRELVKNCLFKSKRDINIFCGHYHLADEQTQLNIHQFITPAASYQTIKDANDYIADNSLFGYRVIEINDGTIHSSLKMFSNAST